MTIKRGSEISRCPNKEILSCCSSHFGSHLGKLDVLEAFLAAIFESAVTYASIWKKDTNDK